MNKKKLVGIVTIIIILAILVGVGIFALSENKTSQIADKLDLGEKYLEELEYEKALATYMEVLEIDPKNVDAYLGMADVYIAMGEYEKAIEVLGEADGKIRAEAIEEKREEIKKLQEEAKKKQEVAEPEESKEPEEVIEEAKVAVEVTVTYNLEDIATEEYGIMEHESATIVGLAEDGTEVWRYEAAPYPKYELAEMGEIGKRGNIFYFNDKGTLIAFEISTGNILWTNTWKSISVGHFTFDEEGNMYLTGSSGPDLLIIDSQGKELKRIDTLDENCYWACDIERIDNYVFITYEGYGDLAYDGGKRVLSYCLSDGTIGYGYGVLEPAPQYSGNYHGDSYQDELHIEYRPDGTYEIDLVWIRLLSFENGEGYVRDGILYFSGIDDFNVGEKHQGTIERMGDMLKMTITDSTLEYSIGSIMYFSLFSGGENLFKLLPEHFSWYDGMSNWESSFTLRADGVFEGRYYDRNNGDSNEQYPNGTIYESIFYGIFSNFTKVDDNVYSMQLSSLNSQYNIDEIRYENGFRYISTEAVGIDGGEEFLVFLPGASFENYPNLNIDWWRIGAESDILPEGYYVIYNVNKGAGFIGTKD